MISLPEIITTFLATDGSESLIEAKTYIVVLPGWEHAYWWPSTGIVMDISLDSKYG